MSQVPQLSCVTWLLFTWVELIFNIPPDLVVPTDVLVIGFVLTLPLVWQCGQIMCSFFDPNLELTRYSNFSSSDRPASLLFSRSYAWRSGLLLKWSKTK